MFGHRAFGYHQNGGGSARACTCLPAGPALGPDFAGTLRQSLGGVGKGAARAPIAWLALQHCGIAAAASVTNRRHCYGTIGATAALQLPAAASYNNVVSWYARWLWHEMVFGSSIWELPLVGC